MPSAPNATGAVLAIRERPEAASGEKPRPIRIAPVTATGVPKPPAPSKKAPKAEGDQQQLQPPVRVTPPIVVCRVSNQPFSTVRR